MLTATARRGVRIFPIHGRAALRPSPPAQRVLGDGRNRPHRRGGRARRVGRHARAGDHRRGQRVRHGQVLQGGARGRRQADPRRGLLDPERFRSRQAAPRGHPVRFARRLPGPVGASFAGMAYQPASCACRDQPRLARGAGHRRADRAVGRGGGRRRPGPCGRQRRDGAETGEPLAGAVSRPLLRRAPARRPAARRNAGRAIRGAGVAARPSRRGDPSDPVSRPRRLQGARGEGVHRPRLCARRPATPAAVHARAALQDAGGNGAAVRRYSAGARELGRDCAKVQSGGRTRQEPPARFSDSPRRDAGGLPRAAGARRARGATGKAVLRPRRARAAGAALSRAAGVRDCDHRADGLRRLLPYRRRLHHLGEDPRRSGRAPAGARARARLSPTRSASRISIRSSTTCCSSASSIPNGFRCPTSTSTSARTGATR